MRRGAIVVVSVAVIAVIFSSGCSSRGWYHTIFGMPKVKSGVSSAKPLDPKAEAAKVKPSKELKILFNAIKGAERVIVIDPATENNNDRDQVALSVLYPYTVKYWRFTEAMVTAKEDLKKPSKGHVYLVRWYKKYKKLGEIAIDGTSGVIEVNLPETATKKFDATKPVSHLFISAEGLKLFNKIRTSNEDKREDPNKDKPARVLI